MSKSFCLINNKFTEKISIMDRGFSYGDGFFETMIWEHLGGNVKPTLKVQYWKRHIQRIKDGCRLMQIKFPDYKTLINQRNKILGKSFNSGMREGILKLIITRGPGGRGYKFEKNMRSTLAFLSFHKTNQPDIFFEKGIDLTYCKTKLYVNDRLSGLKHLNRLDSVLARSEWDDEYFDGVFLDIDENLVEGTMTNIFFVKKDVLITPPIAGAGISGIMRSVVMEKAKLFFKEVLVRKINKKSIDNFDQMFVTNSVIKVLPVKSLNKKQFKICENVKNLISFLNPTKRIFKIKNLEIL
tara:strand:+ start:3558 stop:4448 length:891 start_codon:yes stop_codon:yes gene_type:complete